VAYSELDRKRIERDVAKVMERQRPPPHIRPELDLDYRVDRQSVEIFEVRPRWDNPAEKMEHPVAKAKFVRSQNVWRVFWMRRDLKWHAYEPNAAVSSLESFLSVVERDEYCCFFG